MGQVSSGIDWAKKYTFRFVDSNKYYEESVTITPKTNATNIKIPCRNTHELLNFTAKSFDVSGCDTVEIFASAEVIVHGKVSSSNGFTAGFLALPDDDLGTEYLVDCYTPINQTTQVAISAISNDTTITVNCTSNCTFNGSSVSGSFQLGAGESGILKSTENNTEMTGTYIGSNKPISVIVGAFNIFIPRETNTRNKGHGVVMELLLPISAWGRTHIVPPFRDTPNGWILRISAINSSTNVSLTNCEITGNVTKLLNSKEFADITVNGTNQRMCLIEADQSIQVMQYVASSRTSPEEFGDPSMTVIPAVSRYHGDTSVSKVRKKEFNYTMDVVTTSEEPPMINGSTVDRINQTQSLIINGTQFFLYTFELQIGRYQVTRRNQSDRMWVRLYTLHNTLGAAMLGDVGVSVRNNDKITDIKGKNDELKKKVSKFVTP
nr:uncharacterized protein LOC129282934 [Lytechinus pictus]